MHYFVLKTFNFLKNCVQFFKICVVFLIMMLFLYWIQNLTDNFWTWTHWLNPILDLFIDIGNFIMPGSTTILASTFEYKYIGGVLALLIVYFFFHLVYLTLNLLENIYLSGRKIAKKLEEDIFNKNLELQNIKEQKKINRYQIYVETQLKPKYAHKEFNINLEEQNQILLKFLIKKTHGNFGFVQC